MTTLNANKYNATAQLVANAIARSLSHNEIVTIEAGSSRGDIESKLREECDDFSTADVVSDTTEFWGSDCDGDEWRVHVTSL